MKNVKHSLLAGLMSAALMALTLPAVAEVGTIDFGITNTIAGNTTTTVNVGGAVSVTGQDRAALLFTGQGDTASETGNLTFTFSRSADNSTWETSPRFTWVCPMNGVTAVALFTNLDTTVIGSAGYVKLISVANGAGSGNMTNCVLKIVKKTLKLSP